MIVVCDFITCIRSLQLSQTYLMRGNSQRKYYL